MHLGKTERRARLGEAQLPPYETHDTLSRLQADLGYSEVIERFDALPGVENITRGPVGALAFIRDLPNGSLRAELDSTLTQRGRQTTLDVGRVIELPAGQTQAIHTADVLFARQTRSVA